MAYGRCKIYKCDPKSCFLALGYWIIPLVWSRAAFPPQPDHCCFLCWYSYCCWLHLSCRFPEQTESPGEGGGDPAHVHPKVCKYYNPQIKTAWIENTFCVLYALYTIIVVIIIIDNLAKILWFIYQWDSELFSFFLIVVIVLLNINIEIFVFTYILYLL